MRSLPRCVVALLAALAMAAAVNAHEFKIGSLVVDHPWTRATPKGAKVAGGYMSITNNGTGPDRLIGGTLPHASRFEVHEIRMKGDVMHMRPLPNGLEIKPGQTVKLAPGGYHVMFTGLTQQLKQGERIKGRLTFEKAGTVELEYVVEAMGARGDGHGGH
jgi:copper(I)-binding protein